MPSLNFIELAGLRVGRLLVISQAERYRPKVPMWNCVCDCGKTTVVAGKHLRGEKVRSCGCLLKDSISSISKTHGLTNSPEYGVWCGMKRRCFNKNELSYPSYGGRGITVCSQWVNSFETFFADMGARPSGNFSIERVNPNGDYSPENCTWIPMRDQAANKRNSIRWLFNGENLLMNEWSVKTGIPVPTLSARKKAGWLIERLLSTPLDTSKRNSLAKKPPSTIAIAINASS